MDKKVNTLATRRSTTAHSYNKEVLLEKLRAKKESLENVKDDFEAKLKRWKETAPERFAGTVAAYDPDVDPYFNYNAFSPPNRNTNYQTKETTRGVELAIARVEAMDGDTVVLSQHDYIFQYLA